LLDRRLRRLLLATDDPGTAQDLLNKPENGGKALPSWDGDWPRRFFYTGRDLDFQKVQRTLARRNMISITTEVWNSLSQGWSKVWDSDEEYPFLTFAMPLLSPLTLALQPNP
jgi:hypothetical protein